MSWFKLDDNAPDSEKWLAIPARYRADAWTLWTCLGCRSSRLLTDGRIPNANDLGRIMGMTSSRIRRAYGYLIEANFVCETDSTWEINDFLEYNPSKTQVVENREKERDRKATARARKADLSRRDSALPDPTRPDPSPINIKSSSSLTDHPSEFEDPVDDSATDGSGVWDRSVPDHTKRQAAHLALRQAYARNYAQRTSRLIDGNAWQSEAACVNRLAQWIDENASSPEGAEAMAWNLINGFFVLRLSENFQWRYIEESKDRWLTEGERIESQRGVA